MFYILCCVTSKQDILSSHPEVLAQGLPGLSGRYRSGGRATYSTQELVKNRPKEKGRNKRNNQVNK